MKEEIITVVILEGGKTCREVNYMDKPIKPEFKDKYIDKPHLFAKKIDQWEWDCFRWQEAQSKLRTFEIENVCDKHFDEWPMDGTTILLVEGSGKTFSIGQQYPAVVVNDKQVRIV